MKLLKITFFTAILALFSCETDLPGEGQSSNRGGSNFSYNNSYNGDSYTDFEENQFVDVNQTPTSTFSVDADGAIGLVSAPWAMKEVEKRTRDFGAGFSST